MVTPKPTRPRRQCSTREFAFGRGARGGLLCANTVTGTRAFGCAFFAARVFFFCFFAGHGGSITCTLRRDEFTRRRRTRTLGAWFGLHARRRRLRRRARQHVALLVPDRRKRRRRVRAFVCRVHAAHRLAGAARGTHARARFCALAHRRARVFRRAQVARTRRALCAGGRRRAFVLQRYRGLDRALRARKRGCAVSPTTPPRTSPPSPPGPTPSAGTWASWR